MVDFEFGSGDPVKVCVVLLDQDEAVGCQSRAHKKLLAHLKKVGQDVPKKDDAILVHESIYTALFWREVMAKAMVYPDAAGEGPKMLVPGKWSPEHVNPRADAMGELTNVVIEQFIEAYSSLADLNKIPADDAELERLIQRIAMGAKETDFLARTLPWTKVSQLLSTLHSRLETSLAANILLSSQSSGSSQESESDD